MGDLNGWVVDDVPHMLLHLGHRVPGCNPKVDCGRSTQGNDVNLGASLQWKGEGSEGKVRPLQEAKERRTVIVVTD